MPKKATSKRSAPTFTETWLYWGDGKRAWVRIYENPLRVELISPSPGTAPSAGVPGSLSTDSWSGQQPPPRMTDEDRSDIRAARKALREPGGTEWRKFRKALAAAAPAGGAAAKPAYGKTPAKRMRRRKLECSHEFIGTRNSLEVNLKNARCIKCGDLRDLSH